MKREATHVREQAPALLGAFEGLRGLAALTVFLYHFHHVPNASAGLVAMADLLHRGWVFVDVFFLLSGWVIAHVYAGQLGKTGSGGLAPYFSARIARLLPLHITVILAWIYLSPLLGIAPNIAAIADCLPQLLTLTFAWGPLACPAPVPPAWSISAEAAAYLVFPCLVALGLLRNRAGGVALVTLGVALYAAMEVFWGTIHVLDGHAPLRAVAGFSIGAGLWRLHKGCNGPCLKTLAALQWIAGGALVTGFLVGAHPLFILFAAGAFMLTLGQENGLIAQWLSCPAMLHLGRLSFGIYLWHWFAIAAFRERGVETTLFDALLAVTAIVVLAEVSYRLIEAPGRRMIRARLGAAPQTVANQRIEGSALR
ncbi:MAG: acyltransferase [Paracoccaceae bacterium]|nr:acyltransferase [Paracoccaceae bacterium]